MNSKVIASAPGKIIISGEHAVVYGYPALVAAVGLRSMVSLIKSKELLIKPPTAKEIIARSLNNTQTLMNNKPEGLVINLDSQIPIGSGMGSSAAVAVSVAAAYIKYKTGKLNLEKINKAAYETEKYYHGNPSGVDIAISVYGGFLWYRKELNIFKTFSEVSPVKTFDDNLLLINSGKPMENTKQMVEYVAKIHSKNSKKVDQIFREIETITRGFLKYVLGEENINLVELIKDNEKCLESLGVVSSSSQNLIRKIEKIGGAAKITGAGGKMGNSGILLVYHSDKEKLADFIKKEKLNFLETGIGTKGVEIEKRS